MVNNLINNVASSRYKRNMLKCKVCRLHEPPPAAGWLVVGQALQAQGDKLRPEEAGGGEGDVGVPQSNIWCIIFSFYRMDQHWEPVNISSN